MARRKVQYQRTTPPKDKASLGFKHIHRTEQDSNLAETKKSFNQTRTNLFNAVSVVEGKSHKKGKFLATVEIGGVYFNFRGKSFQQARDKAEKALRQALS